MEKLFSVLEQIWVGRCYSVLKIIDKSVLKLLISPRVSEEYGVLQLSYETTRHFNSASQVAIQCMLFDWAHVQGSAVVRREQHEYDVKKNIRNLSLALIRGIFRTLPDIYGGVFWENS